MKRFKKSVFREYFESIVVAVVLALFIRTWVVQAFKIPTGSMENNLLIGDHMAEKVKMEIGSAYPLDERKTMTVKGREMISGIPRTVEVNDAEIREALEEPIQTIINALRTSLENTPPELAADIIDRGVVITGGGSMLPGLATRFQEEINLPIITVDDPLTSVVLGVGKILDEIELFKKVSLLSSERDKG